MAVAAETRGPIRGRRTEDWTRRKNSSSRMLGSWLGITRSDGYEVGRGFTLSDKSEFTETNNWRLTSRALIRGFRTPARHRSGERGLKGPASKGKASEEKTLRAAEMAMARGLEKLWGFEGRAFGGARRVGRRGRRGRACSRRSARADRGRKPTRRTEGKPFWLRRTTGA